MSAWSDRLSEADIAFIAHTIMVARERAEAKRLAVYRAWGAQGPLPKPSYGEWPGGRDPHRFCPPCLFQFHSYCTGSDCQCPREGSVDA
jgi:hypothetical protein